MAVVALVRGVAYMAPERALGGSVDHRAELFALGVIRYELLTGENPFVRETLFRTVVAVTRVMPPPPSSLNVDVPAELDRIVLRCLAKKSEDANTQQIVLVEPNGTLRILRNAPMERLHSLRPSPDASSLAWLTDTLSWELRLLDLGPER